MNNTPKYSIIIPTRNSLIYLKDCIDSVLSQDFTDYELIVSDNHSADGTYDYVASIKQDNIRLIKPKQPLAMTDHWEWALGHAVGEWIVILGADDGVMPYFFQLSEFLTCKAKKRNIKVINSVRAYFFWDGCQTIHRNKSIIYSGWADYVIKHTKFEMLNATIGTSNYINLPQMYTTSIVHTSVVREVKDRNNGVFYTALIPDANGVANICALENRYIESLIPLAWVGSSPKSNGLIYSNNKDKYQKECSLNFDSGTVGWNPLAGFFNNGDNDRIIDNFKMYFFESLLHVRHLQKPLQAKIYDSKLFKTMLFAAVYAQIKMALSKENVVFLKEIAEINEVSFAKVKFHCYTTSKLLHAILKIREILNRIKNEVFMKQIKLKQEHQSGTEIRLMDAYNYIRKLNEEKKFVQKFIEK
jgi:glycosyltransferase involved in cell wall biosynthesis